MRLGSLGGRTISTTGVSDRLALGTTDAGMNPRGRGAIGPCVSVRVGWEAADLQMQGCLTGPSQSIVAGPGEMALLIGRLGVSRETSGVTRSDGCLDCRNDAPMRPLGDRSGRRRDPLGSGVDSVSLRQQTGMHRDGIQPRQALASGPISFDAHGGRREGWSCRRVYKILPDVSFDELDDAAVNEGIEA